MITARMFLESFLREKAMAYSQANGTLSSVYAKYFGKPLSEHTGAFLLRDPLEAVIDELTESNGSTVVVTREPARRDAVLKIRYCLTADGESWRITGLDRACLLCTGNGRLGDGACPRCHGKCWETRV